METEVQTDQPTPKAPAQPLAPLCLTTISLHSKFNMRESRAFPLRSPRLARLPLSPQHNQRFKSHTPTPVRQMSITPGPGLLPPLLSPSKGTTQRGSRQMSIKLPLLEKVPRRLVRIRREGDWDMQILSKYLL